MIKFFRRVLKRLLSESKFSRDFLYAIGEVILVVFGILIALQINNWNNQCNEDKKEQQLLLGRTTMNVILANQISDLFGKKPSRVYGLAFALQTEKGSTVAGHNSKDTFSWGGYFNTQYFTYPEEQIIGIILKQTQGSIDDKTGWKFPILVGQAIDD